MSIRIAGELIGQAKREERTRCVRILLKHVRKQCAGRCCDNCNCLGLRDALAELRGSAKSNAATRVRQLAQTAR